MVTEILEAFEALSEECKALYPGRRCAPYDTHAEMYDKIGKHATPYLPKHADWTPTGEALPPEGWLLDVKQPSGVVGQLRFERNLWWLPDKSMYVYYVPTAWRLA